jgi:hypothetical protein
MNTREHIDRIAKQFESGRSRAFPVKNPQQKLETFKENLRKAARVSGYQWRFVDYRDGKTVMVIKK